MRIRNKTRYETRHLRAFVEAACNLSSLRKRDLVFHFVPTKNDIPTAKLRYHAYVIIPPKITKAKLYDKIGKELDRLFRLGWNYLSAERLERLHLKKKRPQPKKTNKLEDAQNKAARARELANQWESKLRRAMNAYMKYSKQATRYEKKVSDFEIEAAESRSNGKAGRSIISLEE